MTKVEREIDKDRKMYEKREQIKKLFDKYMGMFNNDFDRAVMAVGAVMDLSYNTVKKYVR